MILPHNLNESPVSGGLNLIIFPGQCGFPNLIVNLASFIAAVKCLFMDTHCGL